jgi:arsenate reductase
MNALPHIEVLIFAGCSYADVALTMVKAVTERMAPEINIKRIEVDTPEKARAVGFLGSPSIRINGQDLEGKTSADGALSCRTYEHGAGVPPEWLIEAALLRALHPRGILFLCVANSARSQMAEGIARFFAPLDIRIWSAGSKPTQVRPEALAVLKEVGIDISHHQSKAVASIPTNEVDTVITLCGEEECPLFLGNARRLHWGLPDPAADTASESERLDAFRKTRDELFRRMKALFQQLAKRPGW